MSVHFRTFLKITTLKSVKDEFCNLIINIVRILIKGLLPVQCTVINFIFTCDKSFATNLSSNTDCWFHLYLDSYDSIRSVISVLRAFLFHFLFAIILLIIEFHIMFYCRKKLMENSRDACVQRRT